MTDDKPTEQLERAEPMAPSEFLALRQADLLARALDLAAIAERAGDHHEAAMCRASVEGMRRVLDALAR